MPEHTALGESYYGEEASFGEILLSRLGVENALRKACETSGREIAEKILGRINYAIGIQGFSTKRQKEYENYFYSNDMLKTVSELDKSLYPQIFQLAILNGYDNVVNILDALSKLKHVSLSNFTIPYKNKIPNTNANTNASANTNLNADTSVNSNEILNVNILTYCILVARKDFAEQLLLKARESFQDPKLLLTILREVYALQGQEAFLSLYEIIPKEYFQNVHDLNKADKVLIDLANTYFTLKNPISPWASLSSKSISQSSSPIQTTPGALSGLKLRRGSSASIHTAKSPVASTSDACSNSRSVLPSGYSSVKSVSFLQKSGSFVGAAERFINIFKSKNRNLDEVSAFLSSALTEYYHKKVPETDFQTWYEAKLENASDEVRDLIANNTITGNKETQSFKK